MITEQQKYISSALKNISFALMAPAGSITFQWLVLQHGAYWGHIGYSVLIFLLGMVFLLGGFVILQEKK